MRVTVKLQISYPGRDGQLLNRTVDFQVDDVEFREDAAEKARQKAQDMFPDYISAMPVAGSPDFDALPVRSQLSKPKLPDSRQCPECGQSMDLICWRPAYEVPGTWCYRCSWCEHKIAVKQEEPKRPGN